MDKRTGRFLLIIGLVSLTMASCYVVPSAGRLRSDTAEIDLEGAESVEAEVVMGAGKLEIGGGADKLLEGYFVFNHSEFDPDIDYRVLRDEIGILEVKQEEYSGNYAIRNFRNDWELNFNGDVPLDLNVTLGAGEGVLDLSGLNLTSFSLKMGAGEANVDLSGSYKDDLEVNIQGGVGELTVTLPADMNVEARVQGGLGSITATGMVRDGSRYVSEYSGPGPVIYLEIEAGIGELNLVVE